MTTETIKRAVAYGNTIDMFDYKLKKATEEVEVKRLKEEKANFIEAFKKEEEMLKRKNAGAGKAGYNDKGNTQHPAPN